MIQINLLPEEFRLLENKKLDLPYLQYAILGGVLFALITLILFIDFLIVSVKLGGINKKWSIVQPQFQILNQLQAEVEGTLKKEKEFIEGYVTTQTFYTQIFMAASEYLPEATWLTEMKMDRTVGGGAFLLKGLVIPVKGKSSIEIIEKYVNEVKNKIPESALRLTTARQTVEKVDLTEFVANYTWTRKQA